MCYLYKQNNTTWQIVYAVELLFVYVAWWVCFKNLWVIPAATAAYMLRRLHCPKYVVCAASLLC